MAHSRSKPSASAEVSDRMLNKTLLCGGSSLDKFALSNPSVSFRQRWLGLPMSVARSLLEAARAFLLAAAYPGLYESRWVRKGFASHRRCGNGGKASRPLAELYVWGGKAFPIHSTLPLISVRPSG